MTTFAVPCNMTCQATPENFGNNLAAHMIARVASVLFGACDTDEVKITVRGVTLTVEAKNGQAVITDATIEDEIEDPGFDVPALDAVGRDGELAFRRVAESANACAEILRASRAVSPIGGPCDYRSYVSAATVDLLATIGDPAETIEEFWVRSLNAFSESLDALEDSGVN